LYNLFTDTPAIFIVAIAGVFAIGALVISKFCSFAHKDIKTQQYSAYECGFDAVQLDVFVSEKNYAISVYLLLELLLFWLLSCVTVLKDYFINIYAIFLIGFLILSARCLFYKTAHK